MNTPSPALLSDSILDTMIQLALALRSHRVIAVGSAAFDIYHGLCRRGFSRVAESSKSTKVRELRLLGLHCWPWCVANSIASHTLVVDLDMEDFG